MPSKPKKKAGSTTAKQAPAPVETKATLYPLVGHDDVKARLSHAIERGRLGQAYAFVGPPGIGKKRFALHLAQSLLCPRRPAKELDPCQACPACQQVFAGTHPDLLLVGRPEDKTELPIATIQALVDAIALKPASGRHKIAVVDDADDLNEESSNCFLKTLEEPPTGSVLILISTSTDTLLPTIRSRCQVVRFLPLDEEQASSLLLRMGVVSNLDEAKRLAEESDGSIELATDLVLPEWATLKMELQKAFQSAPLRNTELSATILEFIESGAKEGAARRTRAKRVIRLAARLLSQWLRGGFEANGSGASRLDPDVIVDLIDNAIHAEYHVSRMAHLGLCIDAWLHESAKIIAGKPSSAIG